MNAKRITKLARRLTSRRGGAIYALIACVALALALYSCSRPPSPQPSTTPTATPIPNAVSASALPPDDVSFTQISAGKWHACGLQADGMPLCWGRNISGSLNIPAGLTLSRISAGLNFTCGLRHDRTIACWGRNDASQASPPNGRFDEISAGRTHACALDDDALTCWGEYFLNGPQTIQNVPLVSAIQSGFGFTCGLTPSDDMACWYFKSRDLVINPGPFIDTGIGLHHACAIRTDRSAFCIEEKPDYFSYYSRLSQPPPTKFAQISGGWHHACGITESSDIECWGSAVPGAPGERLSAPEGKFTTLNIGWRNSCALRSNGHAVCWQQPDVHNPYEQQLHQAFGRVAFEWPVDLFSLPNGEIAVVELKGTIAAYSDEANAAPPKTILDLTDKVVCCEDDNGLISAALDPQFDDFPFLYVYYRVVSKHAYDENAPELVSRLARLRVENGQAVRDSELTILNIPQPRNRHYGGAIRFGADGMLYLGIGENDLSEKAQELDSLFGKIIRIDVRGATPEQAYRVPPDNPFVNNPKARPEIWAYGLRNPWRMDFASAGRLFVGDVGGQTQEEVSIAAVGDNLGWPLCEGIVCREGVEADAAGLIAPLFAYGREDGCAVIGGVTTPWLNNGFVFGDYCSGRMWLLEEDERDGWRTRILAQAKRRLLSFGISADGTVYILTANKPIERMQPDVGEE